MKIAFVASEAAPFSKTGGLGDVAQALPKALAGTPGAEVTVFLPYYSKMKDNPAFETEFVESFPVRLSWRVQHVGVFRLKSRRKKLRIYFIDNEYYFRRPANYGEGDDGERFAYFSMAVLETMRRLGMRPDVIHCNDWQTALIPLLLHQFYQDSLGHAKTVFTIHNIEYQGLADPYFIGDTLGLPPSAESTLVYDGMVNFLKAALLTSDAVTTVSESYARELRYPYFAHGLSAVLSEHAFKLSGIVNGIDCAQYDPATDPLLVRNYDAATAAEGKRENKRALQRELGLPEREDVPVIGMVSRLVRHKGFDLICAALAELMQWDIQLVIVGTGDREYEDWMRGFAKDHPDRFSLSLRFDTGLASRIYAGADLYLMPSMSEPCGLSQIIAMRYGAVPVVNAVGGLRDTVRPFNPETGEGNGFDFQSFTREELLDALRRALRLRGENPEGFALARRNGMTADWSWAASAARYLALYQSLIQK